MSGNSNSLVEQKKFWKTIFEEKKLASLLVQLANTDGGVVYNIPSYGEVCVIVEAGSTLGDNFMSDTYIMKAHFAATSYSTFIKVLPSNLMLRQAAYESNVHQREMDMYTKFFELLRGFNAKHPQIPLDVPDVYYVHHEKMIEGESDGSGTCILLENLKDQGYRMADKVAGPDLEHCRIALTSLAHYHALTIKAMKQWTNPATGKCTNFPPTAEFVVKEKTMFDIGITTMIKEWAPSLIDFAKDIKRKDLVDWLSDLVDRMSEVIVVDDIDSGSPLMCILHGDFWNNNMLFKYGPDTNQINGSSSKKEQEVPIALKLIDFQIARVGHPLNDILYFMYSSVSPEVREKHMKSLFKIYYDILMADLKTLGVKIQGYEWKDFLEDYKKRSILWMFFGGMVMGAVLNKKVVDNLKEEDKKDKLKAPKPKSDVEPEKGASGMTKELEENMKKMMSSNRYSEGPPVLRHRLLKLITEVKGLQSSFDVTPVDYWPLK